HMFCVKPIIESLLVREGNARRIWREMGREMQKTWERGVPTGSDLGRGREYIESTPNGQDLPLYGCRSKIEFEADLFGGDASHYLPAPYGTVSIPGVADGTAGASRSARSRHVDGNVPRARTFPAPADS